MKHQPEQQTVALMHSGKQYSYHIARSLKQANVLDRLYTGAPFIGSPWLRRLSETPRFSALARRFHPQLTSHDVKSWGRFELPEVLTRKIYGSGERYHHQIYRRDEAFDEFFARKVLPGVQASVLWGFQGSCLHSLKAARALGKITICEQAIAHVDAARRLLQEERELHPEWADSIGNIDFPATYEARLREEPMEAQVVLAASSFTRNTLVDAGVPEDNIRILPLGFEGDGIPYQRRTEGPSGRPLKLLYVGRISQRKGLAYLLEAVMRLPANEFELHLFGTKVGEGKGLNRYEGHFHYHGNLPQAELFRRLPEFDLMVFPSIFEGFGMVIVEAMAAGVPVVTTAHTGGADIIEQGKNGYIAPIRDVDALENILAEVRSLSDDDFLQLSHNAYLASRNYTWEAHSRRTLEMLNQIWL